MRLNKRFEEGMKLLGYTIEEIKKWVYCGGDAHTTENDNTRGQSHLNYWLTQKHYDIRKGKPIHMKECVCKVPIIQQCFISSPDGEEILVVGNCCINQYTDKGVSRTCSRCGDKHKNRKDDFCNECRKIIKQETSNRKKIINKQITIPMGKHRGKYIGEIPIDYIKYIKERKFQIFDSNNDDKYPKNRTIRDIMKNMLIEDEERKNEQEFIQEREKLKTNTKEESIEIKRCIDCSVILEKNAPSWKKRCLKCFKKNK
jgi:hypothetical protein